MTTNTANTNLVHDKLSSSGKEKELDRRFFSEEMYTSESTNSKSPMKIGGVENI